MEINQIFPEKTLPWEGLSGPIYQTHSIKVRKNWMKWACLVLCLFLIAGGLVTKYRVALIFGILYILVLLMDKRVVVTGRGVETFYQMRITTHYELWRWEEIDAVVREDRNHPKLVALYFSRGDRVKRLFFTKTDAQAVMDWLRAEHRDIKVAESDEKKPGVPRYYGETKDRKQNKKKHERTAWR